MNHIYLKMKLIGIVLWIVLLSELTLNANGFGVHVALRKRFSQRKIWSISSSSSSVDSVDTKSDSDNKLPVELEQLCKVFAMLRGEKDRYVRLCQLAKTLAPVEESVMVPENVVPGCLSTVHIDCSVSQDDTKQDKVVHFVGESDGLLTKGLLALLIKGLSGSTASEIEAVDPQFIRLAKIDQSLTPSRNNGFLNMLNVMKNKARQAVTEAQANDSPNPMYNAIVSKLNTSLSPTNIELIDNSHEHAGNDEDSTESHFKLYIVSHIFEDIPVLKREQIIYALLPDIMIHIQSIEIQAKAPSEI